MESFANFVRRTGTVLGIIGAACLVAVMVAVVANVILRLLGNSILGTVEIVQIVIVPAAAFALGYTAIKQAHVAVTLVISHLSPPVRAVLAIITIFLSIGIWALIVWRGASVAWEKALIPELTTLLHWPIYPFRYALVLGAAILCLVLLIDLFKALREAARK